jgi:hypothetical protein
LENQITVLEDLVYSTNDEEIIGEINQQIEDFRATIIEKELLIEEAQNAFNEIAEREIEIKQKRVEEEAAQAKEEAFLNAESEYNYYQMLVQDTEASLKYFDEEEKSGDEE